MLTIPIYLIEDNIRYRMDLKNAMKKYIKNNPLITSYEVLPIQNYIDFYERLDTLSINNSDIFIIDIQLNTYFNGIDLGKKIREKNKKSQIVFLTSFNDKAIDIINCQIYPSAYFTKTHDLEVIHFQLIDLFNSLKFNDLDIGETITVSSNSVKIVLNLSDVLYISILKGFRNKLLVQTMNTEIVIDGSLAKLKEKLPSPPFYLGFKSIIVNYNNIKSLSPMEEFVVFKNDSHLDLNSKLIYKLINFQKGLKK